MKILKNWDDTHLDFTFKKKPLSSKFIGRRANNDLVKYNLRNIFKIYHIMLQYTCISTYKNNINSKFVRFDDNFNEPFENYNNYQNNEITHIIFGYKFNKSLNNINLFK